MEELLRTTVPPADTGTITEGAVNIDWSLTTWKGSRREQHQIYLALPFSRKLELNEEMCDWGRQVAEQRRKQGLPYFDPYTGELIASGQTEAAVSGKPEPEV